jgi:hypothetical protein
MLARFQIAFAEHEAVLLRPFEPGHSPQPRDTSDSVVYLGAQGEGR